MAQAEGLNTRVIARVQLALGHKAKAEARTERIAQKGVVALGAAQSLQTLVDLGKCSRQSLAIGVEVGVVVDIDGDAELLFQEGAEGHSVAERWEVGEVESTDNAIGIIGRTGEGKADCYGLVVELRDDALEALDHSGHTAVQIVG